jgi:hypothetical protein
MKNPWILPVATLLVGAVGGYISGKNNTSGTSEESTAENAAIKTRSSNRAEMRGSESSTRRSTRSTGVEQIGRLTGNTNRAQALIDLYGGLTPEQLEEEAGKLDDLPMSERIMASFLLFGRWAEVDPTSAMAFSSTMGFTGGFVRPTILQSWASVDPANAAKYFEENPRQFAMMGMMGGGRGPMGGQTGASIIASEWAKQDPAGALAWANTLTTDKSQALGAVAGEVAKDDPKKAAEMLASIGTGSDLGSAYRSVAERYGATNFSEARAWINTLPADEQSRALASAIGGLSDKDPAAAAAEAARLEEGDTKDRVIPTIIGDLARTNPKAAADLLVKQASEEAKREGVGELMPSWVNQDPAAALNFATSLEPGEVQDSAIQSWVFHNNTAPPADTIKVAEKISDENDRNRTISFTAMRWMREDEAAARAYVESSTVLPEDTKTNILEGRGGWGGGRGRGRGGD